MNPHIQLVASDEARDDAERHEGHDHGTDRDEASTSSASTGSASTSPAPVGLPEEEADRNEILGGAPPPLVAEPGDRASVTAGPRARSSLARLIALAWPPKAKAEGPEGKAADDGEVDGRGQEKRQDQREGQDAGGRRDAPHDATARPAEAEADEPTLAGAVGRQEKRPTAEVQADGARGQAGKAKRSSAKRKGALAAALVASVAVAAIVVLEWPHAPPPAPVEPGMLADGETKLMAPSAALARVPPREASNVSRERPLVQETRPSEIAEMLSFRGLKGDAAGGTATAATPETQAAPLGAAQAAKPEAPPAKAPAEPPETAARAPAPPISEGAVIPPAAPAAKPAEPAEPTKPLDATASAIGAAQPQPVAALPAPREPSGGGAVSAGAPETKPTSPLEPAKPAPIAPSAADASTAQPAAPIPAAPAPASTSREPGLGETAKIESRLADLETAVKDRTSETRARVEAEEAETHTLEKIAGLAALVTRLTGQVKDLQERVQTLSNGSEEKFADLTRRIALGEANRAMTSAENAAGAGAPAAKPENAASDDGEGRTRMKVVAAEVKRSYRIQAASPGLAMLTAVDGSPDDRPVEVAIGTNLPGYGRVLSIEQHGQAWVVKADRGSIE